MTAAITHTYNQVQQHLQYEPALQNAIAESSAGVTEIGSTKSAFAAIQKRHLASQRPQISSTAPSMAEDPVTLGPKIKSILVGVLPTDGSKPRLTPITFYALPEENDRRIRETGFDYVPDFRDAWGVCQFERRYRLLTLENQEHKELEGTYRLYWNENDALPENEGIKKLLCIKCVGGVRRFWYGDVFVMRYSEHPKTFAYDVHNVSESMFKVGHMEAVIRDMWETKFLEKQLDKDRHFMSILEKMDADKAIILQRMTPIERDVLGRFPANTLEILAMTACDDGALEDTRVEKDPNNPDMMRISTMNRMTALDSMGWSGFNSSQL